MEPTLVGSDSIQVETIREYCIFNHCAKKSITPKRHCYKIATVRFGRVRGIISTFMTFTGHLQGMAKRTRMFGKISGSTFVTTN